MKLSYKWTPLFILLGSLEFIHCNNHRTPTTIPANDTTIVAQTDTINSLNPQEQLKYGRAMDAILWSMPVVNFAAMYQAVTRDANSQYNQILYWSKPLNWKNQTLTPNTEALYFMPFFNTKGIGPIVLEIPPAEGGSITGTIMDCWQSALEDVGPAGVDKGKGGKYLVLPPDYKGPTPTGYILLHAETYSGYALLRSIPKSLKVEDVVTAVAYAKRIKLYPLSTVSKQPETIFVDAYDKLFDATIPYNQHYFELLDTMIQTENWITRDRVMINTLKSLGISKGRAFAPDDTTKELLLKALAQTHRWLVHTYESAYPPFFDGEHWFLPYDKDLSEALNYAYVNPNTYPIDPRSILYYCAFSSVKHPGAGQFYLFDSRDKAGNSLSGDKSYKLTVPPKVPVHQYWSVTAYDFETHGLIRDVSIPGRSSLANDLQTNADGTVNIYFSANPPEGKQSNWVSTKPGGKFELIFRLYGPDKSFFEKTWTLPDIEETK